jgi:hypothetical protein
MDELTGPIKVIEESDARIHHARAEIALKPNEVELHNPYPLYEEGERDECGVVDIFLEDGKLVAYAFFDYATPARLDHQNGEPLYLDFWVANNGSIWGIYLTHKPSKLGGMLEERAS